MSNSEGRSNNSRKRRHNDEANQGPSSSLYSALSSFIPSFLSPSLASTANTRSHVAAGPGGTLMDNATQSRGADNEAAISSMRDEARSRSGGVAGLESDATIARSNKRRKTQARISVPPSELKTVGTGTTPEGLGTPQFRPTTTMASSSRARLSKSSPWQPQYINDRVDKNADVQVGGIHTETTRSAARGEDSLAVAGTVAAAASSMSSNGASAVAVRPPRISSAQRRKKKGSYQSGLFNPLELTRQSFSELSPAKSESTQKFRELLSRPQHRIVPTTSLISTAEDALEGKSSQTLPARWGPGRRSLSRGRFAKARVPEPDQCTRIAPPGILRHTPDESIPDGDAQAQLSQNHPKQTRKVTFEDIRQQPPVFASPASTSSDRSRLSFFQEPQVPIDPDTVVVFDCSEGLDICEPRKVRKRGIGRNNRSRPFPFGGATRVEDRRSLDLHFTTDSQQQRVAEDLEDPKDTAVKSEQQPAVENGEGEIQKPLLRDIWGSWADTIKNKWKCPACMSYQYDTADKCVACETPRPALPSASSAAGTASQAPVGASADAQAESNFSIVTNGSGGGFTFSGGGLSSSAEGGGGALFPEDSNGRGGGAQRGAGGFNFGGVNTNSTVAGAGAGFVFASSFAKKSPDGDNGAGHAEKKSKPLKSDSDPVKVETSPFHKTKSAMPSTVSSETGNANTGVAVATPVGAFFLPKTSAPVASDIMTSMGGNGSLKRESAISSVSAPPLTLERIKEGHPSSKAGEKMPKRRRGESSDPTTANVRSAAPASGSNPTPAFAVTKSEDRSKFGTRPLGSTENALSGDSSHADSGSLGTRPASSGFVFGASSSAIPVEGPAKPSAQGAAAGKIGVASPAFSFGTAAAQPVRGSNPFGGTPAPSATASVEASSAPPNAFPAFGAPAPANFGARPLSAQPFVTGAVSAPFCNAVGAAKAPASNMTMQLNSGSNGTFPAPFGESSGAKPFEEAPVANAVAPAPFGEAASAKKPATAAFVFGDTNAATSTTPLAPFGQGANPFGAASTGSTGAASSGGMPFAGNNPPVPLSGAPTFGAPSGASNNSNMSFSTGFGTQSQPSSGLAVAGFGSFGAAPATFAFGQPPPSQQQQQQQATFPPFGQNAAAPPSSNTSTNQGSFSMGVGGAAPRRRRIIKAKRPPGARNA